MRYGAFALAIKPDHFVRQPVAPSKGLYIGALKGMANEKVRRHIALIAAQLMYERQESEYFTAKHKAARQLGIDARYHPKDLPSNREIREQVQIMACLMEGDKRQVSLKEMRLEAYWLMHKLKRFHPALIGSVFTGYIRKGSDIDIHVFSDQIAAITLILEEYGLRYDVERKRIVKFNEERIFMHIHIKGRFEFELTVYPESKVGYRFKSSITGKAVERATLPQLEEFLGQEYPDLNLEEALENTGVGTADGEVDFQIFKILLNPLESVKQSPKYHPEGDALYHSLQVFELAREVRAWDEEFLLAALLHDVGKAIDPADHVTAGLQALEGLISQRTGFLIAHHMDAHALKEGNLGWRKRRRLASSPDFFDLQLLQELDKGGRVPGMLVDTVDEALEFIKEVNSEEGDW